MQKKQKEDKLINDYLRAFSGFIKIEQYENQEEIHLRVSGFLLHTAFTYAIFFCYYYFVTYNELVRIIFLFISLFAVILIFLRYFSFIDKASSWFIMMIGIMEIAFFIILIVLLVNDSLVSDKDILEVVVRFCVGFVFLIVIAAWRETAVFTLFKQSSRLSRGE